VATIREVGDTKTAVEDAAADAAEWPGALARTKFKQSIPRRFIDLGLKPDAVKDSKLSVRHPPLYSLNRTDNHGGVTL